MGRRFSVTKLCNNRKCSRSEKSEVFAEQNSTAQDAIKIMMIYVLNKATRRISLPRIIRTGRRTTLFSYHSIPVRGKQIHSENEAMVYRLDVISMDPETQTTGGRHTIGTRSSNPDLRSNIKGLKRGRGRWRIGGERSSGRGWRQKLHRGKDGHRGNGKGTS